MEDYHQEVIPTVLSRDQLFELVTTLLPELAWRRGESEAEGALNVSGRNDLGAVVTFWFDSDRYRETSVTVSFRSAEPDGDGSMAWRPALEEQLTGEVFPAIREHRRPGLAPGVSIVWDLHRVLMPGGGEDDVTVSGSGSGSGSASGDELAMRVAYTTSAGEAAELTIVFHRAAFHLREPFPGRTELDGSFSIVGLDTCELADLGPTPFLHQWVADPANQGRFAEGEAHHYFVMFWDAGSAHHIIASSFEVLDHGVSSGTER